MNIYRIFSSEFWIHYQVHSYVASVYFLYTRCLQCSSSESEEEMLRIFRSVSIHLEEEKWLLTEI